MGYTKDIILEIKYELQIFWLNVFALTPWHKAIVLSAWWKYKESELFRQRWISFSRETAAQLYTFKEHMHFVDKVKSDKVLMKRIWLHPYQVINEKISIDDENLRQFITL